MTNTRTGLMAASLAAVIACSAAFAQSAQAQGSQAQEAGTPNPTAAGKQIAAATEQHIASLKSQLGITSAQEPAWDAFTSVMRQNAQEFSARLAQRGEGFEKMNAVQDLQSYADITALRAQETGKLVAPFQALYAQLSPQQQATADHVFHKFAEKGTHPKG